MVPVKTMKEYELLQDLTVLFCETVDRYVCRLHCLVIVCHFLQRIHCQASFHGSCVRIWHSFVQLSAQCLLQCQYTAELPYWI